MRFDLPRHIAYITRDFSLVGDQHMLIKLRESHAHRAEKTTKQMLDILTKASTKFHREKRRAYSVAQSHIVNYSRDLILVDKMAKL